MTGKASTRRARVERKERAIVDAAREVFMAHGLEGARMAEIARRSQVAEGTIYLYFEGKDGLVEAVVRDFYRRLKSHAEDGLREVSELRAQLEVLALSHMRSCLEEWPLLEIADGAFRRHIGRHAAIFQDLNRDYVTVFDGVVRPALARGELDPTLNLSHIRDLFYGGLEYACRTARIRGQTPEMPAVADTATALVNMLLVGSRPPQPTPPGDLEAVTARLEAVAARLEATES